MNTNKTSLGNESQPSCLGAVISRFFVNPIDIYYDCFEKQMYVTVTITKLFKGGKLSIGNGIYIKEKCKNVGLIISQDKVYGYVIFKYGYLLFGGTQKQTHFGYSLFESKTGKSSKSVSTFCTYVPFSEQNLKDKIHILKYGL